MIHDQTIAHLYAQREAYRHMAVQACRRELTELYRRYVEFYDGILEDALALWEPVSEQSAKPNEDRTFHWSRSRRGRSGPLNTPGKTAQRGIPRTPRPDMASK